MELMVVLVLIGLVATLSIPRIEEWVARQQTRQFVSQLIADFSKARTLAANYYVHDSVTGSGAVSNQSAIYFLNKDSKSSYFVLFRNSPQTDLFRPETDTVIKKVVLPGRIQLVDFNGQTITTSGMACAFTSSGLLKDSGNNLSSTNQAALCGGQPSNKHYPARLTFKTTTMGGHYWGYRVEINAVGEYRVCQAFDSMDFIQNGVELRSI